MGVLNLVAHTANRDQAAMSIAQKVVQALYKSTSALGREAYALLLQRLCESYAHVNGEVRDWLLHADDKVSLDVHSTSSLLTSSEN